MKKILLYGDSNLWGYRDGKRIEDKYQWANMLSDYLGSNYKVIQEGLPGRVAGNIDKEKPFKNGKDIFDAVFRACSPLDYVVIALGTNDLSFEYNRTSKEIYDDLMWYKERANEIYLDLKFKERFFKEFPKFIYVLPGNFDYENDAKDFFDKERENERQKLIKLFKDNYKDTYIELNNIDLVKGDGMHYSVEGQKQVFDIVKKYFDVEK